MFAVVSIAGFQEKVSQGEKLRVPLLKADPGKSVMFDKVYLIAKSDSDVAIGTPYVSGASVEAKVIEHGKGEKIRVLKMKRRKRYRRVKGHRQGYTDIEVVKISVGKTAEALESKTGEKAPRKMPAAKTTTKSTKN